MWDLYKRRPGFVLGFHGCDEDVGEKLLSGQTNLIKSRNEYDWLGHGMYFWEGDPARALSFAQQGAQKGQRVTQGKIKKPFVVGAIIDLGYCCNLVDTSALVELEEAYHHLVDLSENANEEVPRNVGTAPDFKARRLDCLVIETMHKLRRDNNLLPYNTVRSPFWEGGPLYDGAGFTKQAHIQIAVRHTKSILGFFRPKKRTPFSSTAKLSLESQ